MENALFKVNIEISLPKCLENTPDILDMGLKVLRIDQNIIKVDYAAEVNEVPQRVINIRLERSRCVY